MRRPSDRDVNWISSLVRDKETYGNLYMEQGRNIHIILVGFVDRNTSPTKRLFPAEIMLMPNS